MGYYVNRNQHVFSGFFVCLASRMLPCTYKDDNMKTAIIAVWILATFLVCFGLGMLVAG